MDSDSNNKTQDDDTDENLPVFKPRVLVVDDEKRIRDLCHRMLSGEGFDVSRAENGEQGISMIDESHYDIILLDLMMPGVSGLDVLEKVKALHPDTVVIVITGYATIEHSIEAMKKGAFDFLPKPFTPQDLRLVVSKAIKFLRSLADIATEKSRMRVMINTLGDGVLITDAKKQVVLANPAFLKFTGCRETTIIGRLVDDILKNAALNEVINNSLALSPDKFAEQTDEIVVENKDESDRRICGIRCIPFRDRVNRTLGTITVVHDITARKKIEQMKSDFVSMVAHEIKSPLNSILMQITVLTDGLAGELTEKQKEILGRSADKIKALTSLSSELLDLAKIESGLINQEKESIDLNELVKSQVAFYKQRAAAKSIKLDMMENKDSVCVMGNRANIEEVISNLITNAIRYTPEGGRITAGISLEKDYGCIRISDTGFGIAKEDIDRIFDRFIRIKNEKTRYINGTGLGLAILKSIVDAHHGMIQVESEVDKGSTFSVYLPIKTA